MTRVLMLGETLRTALQSGDMVSIEEENKGDALCTKFTVFSVLLKENKHTCFAFLDFFCSIQQDMSRGLCRVMVSLAEMHMKLLFAADSEERELQSFTLVQLLLVGMLTVFGI